MFRINKNKIIIMLIIVVTITFMSTIFAILNLNNENIINGITVEGIDLSGISKSEALKKFQDIETENINKNITLTYKDFNIVVNRSDLEVEYDINNTIDKAFLYGRDNNIFVNNFNILKAKLFGENINIDKKYNEEKINNLVNMLNESLPDRLKKVDYYIEDNNLIIIPGKDGIIVNEKELIVNIKKEFNKINISNEQIKIPVIELKTEEINIEKIHNEIYKEEQDAYITKDPIVVYPEVNGVDFLLQIDEIKELLKIEKDEYIIPLKITVPNVTLKTIGEEAFPNELAEYSTKYDLSNYNRSTNIGLATEKINEVVIMPNEIFSYNKILGKRTIEEGFKEAGAYSAGKIVEEVGGGICQVSSTLYNAVLYANLEIVERRGHYFESSYVEPSRDATVSWGSVDFKFKNNRKYPIKILATSNNGVEKIKIMGLKEEVEYEIIIQSKKISSIERSVKYEYDSTITQGKEIIVQQGHDGCNSQAYRILKLNGEIISKTLLSEDTYHALERIIKTGTKQ